MAGKTWRRRAAVAAAATVAALTLVACGGDNAPSASPTTPGGGQLGGAPTATTSPTGAATATTTAPPNGAPTYPKLAKDYAIEFMKAWSAKNYDRVGQLGVQSMVQQAKDSNNGLGGVPNNQWTVYSCSSVQPDATIGCTVRNAHGDDARVTMVNSQLGAPVAVNNVLLERTEYPSDPGSYAAAFIHAWGQDNAQRMARYSSNSIKNYFDAKSPPGGGTSQYTPVDQGSDYVRVQIGILPDGTGYYTFKVIKNPGGKAFAIKSYCTTFDCVPS